MQRYVISISFFRSFWVFSLFLGLTLPTLGVSQTVPGRYLKEVLPCNGCDVSTLYPIIQWPVKKGKNISYDVELDRDTLANTPSILFKSALPYSIFIPYIPLEKGIYYWRYKVNGLQWSPYFSFSIKEDYQKNIPPDPALFLSKIPAGHPRLLINNINESRSIDAKNEDRIAIISEADELLFLPIPDDSIDTSRFANLNDNQKGRIEKDAAYQIGHQAYQRIYLFCQAYLLTGDEKYFRKAKEMGILVTQWDRNGYSGMVDFSDAKCMLGMALVFDTFYDKLSDGEKKLLLDAIQIRAKYFYQLYKNDVEVKILSGHFWQHILHFLFQTNLILFNHVDETKEWLTYYYDIFFAKSPILSGESGGWTEGLSYFTMNMETLIDIPFFVKSYTGYDFYQVQPFYKSMASWLVYHVPPGAVGDGFADNSTHLYSPGAKYQAFAMEMAKLTQLPLYKWYADKCREYEPIDISKESTLRWFRLSKTQQLVMPTDDLSIDFPLAKLFSDGGAGSMQTNAGNPASNLAIFLRASPIGAYGHILAEQNTFNISYKGKRVFFKTGYKLGMDDPHRTGWSQLTKSANGVLINGNGQVISTEGISSFKRLVQGTTLAYVKSDASLAYKSTETKENFGVKKFVRHYLLLPPKIIIILDELESDEPAEWQWLLHAENSLTIDKLTHQLLSSDSCIVKFFSSSPSSMSIKDSFDIPLVNFRFVDEDGEGLTTFDTDQKHFTLKTDSRNSKQRFLSVFSFGNDKVEETKYTESKEAIRNLHLGDWEINMVTDTEKEPLFELFNSKTGTYFNMFGNKTEWSAKWTQNLRQGNSYLLEKDRLNNLKHTTNGDFNKE